MQGMWLLPARSSPMPTCIQHSVYSAAAPSCAAGASRPPFVFDLLPTDSIAMLPPRPTILSRLLLAKYGAAGTAAAVVGIGSTVVNMH